MSEKRFEGTTGGGQLKAGKSEKTESNNEKEDDDDD
jgi:hypothetical protein